MLVGVYLDPRLSSTTSKSAESGNHGAFVVVHYSQPQFILAQMLRDCRDNVYRITSGWI